MEVVAEIVFVALKSILRFIFIELLFELVFRGLGRAIKATGESVLKPTMKGGEIGELAGFFAGLVIWTMVIGGGIWLYLGSQI